MGHCFVYFPRHHSLSVTQLSTDSSFDNQNIVGTQCFLAHAAPNYVSGKSMICVLLGLVIRCGLRFKG